MIQINDHPKREGAAHRFFGDLRNRTVEHQLLVDNVFNGRLQGAAASQGRGAARDSSPPRIEAGLLDAGSDFDVDVTPFAAGLGHTVDPEKTDFSGMRRLRNHIIDELGATRLEGMHNLV